MLNEKFQRALGALRRNTAASASAVATATAAVTLAAGATAGTDADDSEAEEVWFSCERRAQGGAGVGPGSAGGPRPQTSLAWGSARRH